MLQPNGPPFTVFAWPSGLYHCFLYENPPFHLAPLVVPFTKRHHGSGCVHRRGALQGWGGGEVVWEGV